MITLFESTDDDFSTMGMLTLHPTECTVSEEVNGKYELELTEPVNSRGTQLELFPGRIIKAPSPTRESPDIYRPEQGQTSVTYEIWRCSTSTRLYIRDAPNGHKIASLSNGDKVMKIAVDTTTIPGATWFKVTTMDESKTGFVYPNLNGESPYLVNTGTHKTIKSDTDIPSGEGIKFQLAKDQLFRIYSVEKVSEERAVKICANHISYDLLGIVATIGATNIDVSLGQLFQYFKQTGGSSSYQVSHNPGFIFTDYTNGRYKGTWNGANLLNILMDESSGILKQNKAQVIRDNFHIYIVPTADRFVGMNIRYGKNLLSASMKTDISEVITRIYPRGSLSNGNAFTAEEVDSPYINDYGILAKVVKYNYKAAGTTATSADKLAIQQLARKEYSDDKIDIPKYTMNATYIQQELSPEFVNLANKYSLHLHDNVRVYDPSVGIGTKDPRHPNAPIKDFTFTSYKYDVLKGKYTDMTFGDLEDIGK